MEIHPDDSPTMVRMELKMAGQKMISEFMIHNEEITEQLKLGVERAINDFDFETEVAEQGRIIIKKIISDSLNASSLKHVIQSNVDDIINEIIEKELSYLKKKK